MFEVDVADIPSVNRSSSLHVGQQVRERLIGELELNQPIAWIVQIVDDIDGDRHHERKRQPVKTRVAGVATADHVACQERADKPERQ